MTPRTIALLFVVAALPYTGSGPVNGDAAVYAHQASTGGLAERTVHVGYIALAQVLAPLGPTALDALSCLCLGLMVWAAGRLAARMDGDSRVAALAMGALALPLAPFAEVDPLWGAALALGAVLPATAAVWMVAVGAAVSPTALLGLPWLAASRRRGWGIALGGVTLWLPVLLWCGSDWWHGPRGVLTVAPTASLSRVAAAWWVALALPGLAAPIIAGLAHASARTWLAGLMALAPLALVRFASVPAWLPAAVWLAVLAGQGARHWTWPRWLLWGPLLVQIGAVEVATARLATRVSADNDALHEMVRKAGAGQVAVGPWTWGVRWGLARTGQPDEGWMRPGAAAEDGPEVVWGLPPGELPDIDGYSWERVGPAWRGRRLTVPGEAVPP